MNSKMDELGYFNMIIQFFEKTIGLNSNLISKTVWKTILKKRMLVNNIPNFQAYYNKVVEQKDEYDIFVDCIVTPETWFFRDKKAFEYCTEIIRQKEFIFSKILSFPCSSGEEPYSIAISLLEGGIFPERFIVDAIDISGQAINKAKAGIYTQNSFRSNFNHYQYNYFFNKDESFHIIDKVKKQVRFFKKNVLEDFLPFETDSYHFIFCRNLFIYLNKQAQQKVFNLINRLLKEDGFFIVGPSETHLVLNAGFFPIAPHACAFKKAMPLSLEEKKVLPSLHPLKKDYLIMEACQLANEGYFEEAEKICIKSLQLSGPQPEPYYLLGLVKHASGKEEEAEFFFKKVIYLAPDHYESLIYLALLNEKRGEKDKAGHYHARAKKILLRLAAHE